MERSSVSARVRLALKRQAFFAETKWLPQRSSYIKPEVTHMLGYMRPIVLAKSVRSTGVSNIAELREKFHESRMSLYRRLVGLASEDDCGCEGEE